MVLRELLDPLSYFIYCIWVLTAGITLSKYFTSRNLTASYDMRETLTPGLKNPVIFLPIGPEQGLPNSNLQTKSTHCLFL